MKFFLLIALACMASDTEAQICTGSLGDPIVNVTFGAGESIGAALSANTTSSLGYQPTTCPPDGFYSIVNYTSGCFSAGNDVTWHTTTDHTGDTNGYFMLINASIGPSDFYIQTITGLCEGTSYQFAAWILNMCSVFGTLPNITLTIETTGGLILASYNTGDIPIINPVTWKQYGFNFVTPANTSTVVLRMYNNAPGGVGNDVALDDITFRPIGPAVSVSALSFNTDTLSLCSGEAENILLQSSVENCYPSTAYQWQVSTDNGTTFTDIPGATGNAYTRGPTIAGVYEYRLTVAEQNNINITTCRVASKPLIINVFKNEARTISITASPGAVCEGKAVLFTAVTTYGGTAPVYQWMLNGRPVGGNSDSYTNSSLVTGDNINCILTSSLPCNTPAISDSITVTVNRKKLSTITASICEGSDYAGYAATGIYTDIFTGSNGCDSIRTLNLTVLAEQHSVKDTTICFGTSFEGYSTAGVYDRTYPDTHGCDSISTIILHVLPDINNQLPGDTVLCTGDLIVILPGDFDSYLWQDGSTGKSYTAVVGGTYSVRVTNKCGAALKTIFINEKDCHIMFPSAFTPNGDGLNDAFRILNAYNLTYYYLNIFNRWGQRIFESDDPQKGWDGNQNGTPANEGPYAWTCNYKRAGSTAVTHLKGVVILLR